MKNGIIHYLNPKKCLYVIRLDDKSFTVFECFGSNIFNVGDVVSGELDRFGLTDILNFNTNQYHYVLIQNVGLNETLATDKANLI